MHGDQSGDFVLYVDTGAIRVKQSFIQIQVPDQDTPQIK